MKKSLIFTALILGGCSQLTPTTVAPEKLANKPADAIPVAAPLEEVENNDTTQSVATDFEHIFIDSDMTFTGTLPCADCPGISYHVNLYRDGRFEVRQEYLDRNQVNIVKGIWLLERRSLHLVNQQQSLPAFSFVSNNHLSMLDLAGKPISSSLNYQLKRESKFKKIDNKQAMLGLYQLQSNQASFTLCSTGESVTVANTQHHLPVMRQYQQDQRFSGKQVIATLTGRKGQNNQGEENLYIDKFDQFWPGAACPDVYAPGKIQGIVWRAEKLDKGNIPQNLNIRAIFDANDRLYGFAGCNSFNAEYKQKSSELSIGSIASTRKFCADSSETEQKFTQALQNADRVEVNGDKLQLFRDNQIILQFKPALN